MEALFPPQVRTNKAEFESLGDDAWWMHEARRWGRKTADASRKRRFQACMEDADLQDYYDGEEVSFFWGEASTLRTVESL